MEPEIRCDEDSAWQTLARDASNGAPPSAGGAKPSKFALEWLSDISLNLNDEWLFKGLVPRQASSAPSESSGSLKTFILIHLAVCGALGREFGGHRCKNPGPFVYVAAEDPSGVKKRLFGYCLAHKIPQASAPIAIVGVAPNLRHRKRRRRGTSRQYSRCTYGQGVRQPVWDHRGHAQPDTWRL